MNNNLFTDGNKSWQNLNVNSLSAKVINADTIVIPDIGFDDINVNTISTLDTGKVVVDDDVIITGAFKLSSIPGQDIITSPSCFHLQNNVSQCLYLQSDRDGLGPGTDSSFIRMNKDAGEVAAAIEMGSGGDLYFSNGNTTNNSSGGFNFYSSRFFNNGDSVPTYNGASILLMSMNTTEINFYRSLDMNANSILNAGAINQDLLITNNVNNTYNNMTFDFNIVDGTLTNASNKVIVNASSPPNYVGVLDDTTVGEEFSIINTGVYALTLIIDNATVLDASSTYKFSLINTAGYIVSRIIVGRSEPIQQLNQSMSITDILNPSTYTVVCQRIIGSDNPLFNCDLKIIRIK